MNKAEFSYLQFVKFKNIDRWDIKSLSGNVVSFRFPAQKLKTFLSKADIEWIDIENDKKYPILGVHAQGEGVYINKIASGKELTMKRYQKSKANTLFYCKVRTVKGQWGKVFPEFANSYDSSNMQYLDIDYEKINPEYFINLLKLKHLTDIWDKKAIGADGRHFTLQTLLDLQIPLPSLPEQETIVSFYKEKIKKAEDLEQQAEQIGIGIETYLLDKLGIDRQKKTGTSQNNGLKFLRFIRFKDTNRWDVSYYSKKNSIGGKYEITTIDECIDHFMQDPKACSLRIETSKSPEKEFQYIGMESVEKGTGLLVEEKKVKGIEVKSQTIKVPYHYFLYGKLRPYLNKYWYNESKNDNIVCSSEFYVFSIKPSINELYFKYYLSSSAVQQQISNAFQGARMPRINERTFKAIQIPIPPIEIQNTIVEHINEQKAQIKELKKQAEELRKEALIEFEKEIFI